MWAVTILFYAAFGYILYRIVRRPVRDSFGGRIEFRKGRVYEFVLGDYLQSYQAFGYFNGLDIFLPFQMPHIYLDSRKAGGHRVGAIFDSSQRISLEGNFSQYFNVFVPQRYETVALSVLSPDVMQVLQRHAADFDVEIYGEHLRIISNRDVVRDTELQTSLMGVAEKVLQELEDRQRSWTLSNTMQSIDQDLRVYPESGFRRFNRYVSWKRFWLSIFWCMCIVPFFVLTGYYLWMENYGLATIFLAVTVAEYLALQWFTGSMQASSRFHSRWGSKPQAR
ncbi:MAG: hypothetical protein JWP13_227 [Candidatus Saccharibacteria bacterium]|nr:hypothetical protein [Candidatus Saccharibacteria bacterium]